MKYYLLLVFTLSFTGLSAQSSEDSRILMSVDDHAVTAAEFMHAFYKNYNQVQDEEQKKPEVYLELFKLYKMKVRAAYDLGLDTLPAYQKELAEYRYQLSRPYFTDTLAGEILIKEAFEHMQNEIRASHILIGVGRTASPADTLAAFNRAKDILAEIASGSISFDAAAKKYSTDPSAKSNGGDLGYFGPFQMVYEFEKTAYSTGLGSCSDVFRTDFGYHILKVSGKRPSQGEVEVAHIMLARSSARPNTEVDLNITGLNDSLPMGPEQRIEEIYKKLQKGESFESLAKRYSNDVRSGVNGGKLPRFGRGKMLREFEREAYALEKEGDFSKPFETPYGFHIMKLLRKYPADDYHLNYPYLKQKVEKDKRSKQIDTSIAPSLEKRYSIGLNQELMEHIERLPSDLGLLEVFERLNEKFDDATVVLRIEEKEYLIGQCKGHIEQKGEAIKSAQQNSRSQFNEFKRAMLIEYYEEDLENIYPEFSALMREYREGILLFNLLQREVWNKAVSDSEGLDMYYKAHAEKYRWGLRADIVMADCRDKSIADTISKFLEGGVAIDSIKARVNEGARINARFKVGLYSLDNKSLPQTFEAKPGIRQYKGQNNRVTLVYVKNLVDPQTKSFQEARPEIISDYQKFLEHDLNARLQEKYQVKLNRRTWKWIKRQHDQRM